MPSRGRDTRKPPGCRGPSVRLVMGARLALVVFTAHASRKDREFRVLGRMALSALDEPSTKNPNAPIETYWGGWEPLALALGYEVPDANPADAKATRARNAAHTAVKRALKP